MRVNFKFSSLFGTAYKRGSLIFTNNGFGLLSPVGNQITVFDLKKDETSTIELNSHHDLECIALSPSLPMLIAVNNAGEASVVSLITGAVISVYPFRHPVATVSFSPNGRFLAVAKGHCVMVFFAPSAERQFNHLELYRIYYGFTDNVISIDWSSDSSVFIAGSSDNSCRIFSTHRLPSLIVYTLSSHKNPVIGCFFMKQSLDSVTVSSDGDVCLWEADTSLNELKVKTKLDNKCLFKLSRRFRYFSTGDTLVQSPATAASYHKDLRLLATGFDSGLLMLHILPDFSIISECQLFGASITSLSINRNGDWIGAACECYGQLAVWEWRSQTYHLKAESHAKEMTSLAYSPDGLHLATGGYDAKVKVWRIAGGRAIVTFKEHTAAVTGVVFPSLNAKVVVSSSLDGTVRAHDLVRYRNFRTLTVPTRLVQFACIAVDGRGTLAAAGGLDTFDAYVWSVKTGQLLTILSGHTAPISGLAFNPDISGQGIELATVGWDSTLRTWDVTGNDSDKANISNMGSQKETVNFSCDVLSIAYRGDGKQLALSLLNGNVVFYDPLEGIQTGTIDGHRDLGVTQTNEEDLVTPIRAAQTRKFQSIAYSVDGNYLLGAGDSKYICLYSVADKVLVKRFEVTCNLSLGGVQEIHDRRRFLSDYSRETAEAKTAQRPSLPVPASRKGEDNSRRRWRPEVRVSALQFSPTGDSFAATTTEGVLVYALASAGTGFSLASSFGFSNQNDGWLFETMQIDEHTTPSNSRLILKQGKYAEALDMAIRLQLHELVEEVMEQIPITEVDYLARQLPLNQVVHFLIAFLARQLSGRSRHIELYVHWADSVLRSHCQSLRRLAANSALTDLASRTKDLSDPLKTSNGQTQMEALAKRSKLCNPGFLSSRSEWAVCQANLVRLQASLQQVKTSLINRFEAVDNLWHYLYTVSQLNHMSTNVQLKNWDSPNVSMLVNVSDDLVDDKTLDIDSELPEFTPTSTESETPQKYCGKLKHKKKKNKRKKEILEVDK